MLPARFFQPLFALVLSGLMSALVSLERLKNLAP